MMKEITVVMPVYKVEKYVSECLDSIINQTFDCFECIIIDDCSPDNSMRLIEEKLAGYKGNISFRIVRNERNEGVSAARNKGIELSRGGYLFFIDSDDMLYENCIIRKSKFPQNPKRSVRFSGKRTKRSVQKRKARNTQKAETKVL